MKISDILSNLETYFPLSKQETWDHSGLQLGNVENDCQRVLLCLNVDQYTIKQAIENECQLIISHHPFLFHPVSTIDQTTVQGENITLLIQHGITVYSMHTNYDALAMNVGLLKKIGCFDIQQGDETGTLRIGRLKEPILFNQLIAELKQLFSINHIRVCGNVKNQVQTIALCAGSGHDYIDEALKQCDVFITGDLTYTHAMSIISIKEGFVLELPHFIEEEFKYDIKKYIPVTTIIADEKDYFINY